MILRNRSKCRRPATFVSPLFLVATDRIMRARPCRDRERTRIESFTETSSRRSLTEIQKLHFLLLFLSFPPPPSVSHRFIPISFLFFFLLFFILQTHNSTYAAGDKGFTRENIASRTRISQPFAFRETRTNVIKDAPRGRYRTGLMDSMSKDFIYPTNV